MICSDAANCDIKCDSGDCTVECAPTATCALNCGVGDTARAAQVPGIDVIIGGHSHTAGIGVDVQPGYPLVTFDLTGDEIKQGLELTANAQDQLQSDDFSLQVSGVTLTYEPGRPPFDRVTAVTDISTRIVDRDPAAPGLQELKQWQALVQYLSGPPDADSDGIPDIPDAYAAPPARCSVAPWPPPRA